MTTKAPPIPNYAPAMLLALAGFFLWSCGDAAIRSLQNWPVELTIFSYAGSAVVWMTLLSKPLGGFAEVFKRPRLKLRMFRGAVLVGSNVMAVIAFTHLDMATAYALIFLSPFMAKMVSWLLTGEKPSGISLLLSGLAFAGVLIILRPGMIPLSLGSGAALVLTLFFSLGYSLGRYIGGENQTPLSLILFQYSFLTIGSLPLAAPHFGDVAFGLPQMAAVALAGFTAVAGTVCASTAFVRAPASVVAPLHYSQMLWGILFGLLFFGEFPDGITLLGASIIIGAGLLLVRFSRKGRV
jgi:drug/metabolite transporter (DMT)-like permease